MLTLREEAVTRFLVPNRVFIADGLALRSQQSTVYTVMFCGDCFDGLKVLHGH